MSNNRINGDLVLVTLAGSRAYGTNIESSDVDLKGIFIGNKSMYLGIKEGADNVVDLKTTENKWTDEFVKMLPVELHNLDREGTAYELKRFIKLAMQCNPNILDVLFCDDSDVIACSSIGSMIRRIRQGFLSKTALNSFIGYAISQIVLVETMMKNASGDERFDLALARKARGLQSGQDINKHAMHVVRLLQCFEELLLTGQYNVKRKNKDELLQIRNGEWDYPWLKSFLDSTKLKIESLKKDCILPDHPNYEMIDDFCVNVIGDHLFFKKCVAGSNFWVYTIDGKTPPLNGE